MFSVIGLSCSAQNNTGNNFEMQIAMAELGNQSFNKLDWQGYADLLDPEGLELFRSYIMPGLQKLILNSQTDSVNLYGTNFHSETIQNEDAKAFFVDMMNMTTTVSPELKATFSGMTSENLGAIAEGDSLIHVVNRAKLDIGGNKIEELNVISLKKIDGEWKLLLSPKIEGIAQMIRRGLPQ